MTSKRQAFNSDLAIGDLSRGNWQRLDAETQNVGCCVLGSNIRTKDIVVHGG